MHRPLGLKLIAWLEITGGVLGLLADIGMPMFRIPNTKLDILSIAFSVVQVILGIGLWRLRNWARWTFLIWILSGWLALIAVLLFTGSFSDLPWWLTSLFIAVGGLSVWMVIYLFLPRVGSLFLSSGGRAAQP